MGIKPNSVIHHGGGGVIIPVSAAPPIETLALAEFLFTDGSGQVLTDSRGGYNGQLGSSSGSDANDPVWGSSPAKLTFDGSNDSVKVNALRDALGTGSQTFVAVARCTNYSTPSHSTIYGSYTQDKGLLMDLYSSLARFRVAVVTTGGTVVTQSSRGNYSIDTTKDYFLVGQFESGVRMRGWEGYDGSCSRTIDTATSYTTLTTGTDQLIGRNNTGGTLGAWNGHIYYCAAFNWALTESQIQEMYTYVKSVMSARSVTI